MSEQPSRIMTPEGVKTEPHISQSHTFSETSNLPVTGYNEAAQAPTVEYTPREINDEVMTKQWDDYINKKIKPLQFNERIIKGNFPSAWNIYKDSEKSERALAEAQQQSLATGAVPHSTPATTPQNK